MWPPCYCPHCDRRQVRWHLCTREVVKEGRVQCGSQFQVQSNKVESQGGRHLKRPVTSQTESDDREVEMKACQDSIRLVPNQTIQDFSLPAVKGLLTSDKLIKTPPHTGMHRGPSISWENLDSLWLTNTGIYRWVAAKIGRAQLQRSHAVYAIEGAIHLAVPG